MKWIKNIFNKKTMPAQVTPESLAMIRTELAMYKKFQWMKGDRANQVTTLRDVSFDETNVWIEFVDGSRINYAKMDEYILKVMDDSELLEIKGTPVAEAKAKIPVAKREANVSPIYALLKKQKPNAQTVDISLTLNLPSVELYKVLLESFENAEKEIVDYIVTDINVDIIKDAVKESIIKYYQSA